MTVPDKQYTGDGSDNYLNAARKTAEVIKQLGQSSAEKAVSAGTEAVSNAAAFSVQTAAEGGAAAAGTASGAALAGPAGAAISAAWAMRHTLFKVLVTVCLALLFIIIMVVSLPSIVFNNNSHTDAASGLTGISAIYNDMADTVANCVTAAYETAKKEVERIIANGGYDYALSNAATIDNGCVSMEYDICYILAAYSASMNQEDTTKQDLKRKLDAAASRMFTVTCEVKETTVAKPPAIEGEPPETVTVRYAACTIHSFDMSAILSSFGIDPEAPYGQFKQRTGDVIESMALALKFTLYVSASGNMAPPITDEELAVFLNNLTCSPARKELIQSALSLVGKVPYFWGGKSPPGWNDEWNTPKLVTATGDKTTGALQPYGLDCSGFTDWAYKTALGADLPGGSEGQWYRSTAITEDELKPGDLGFMNTPNPKGVNHVLIYTGRDSGGNMLWVHCEGGSGVIMNSPSYVKYYRRVKGIDLDGAAVSGANGG